MVEEGRTWGQESESEQLAFFRFCSIVLLRVLCSCNSGIVANKLLSASLMSGRCHGLATCNLLVAISHQILLLEAECLGR